MKAEQTMATSSHS